MKLPVYLLSLTMSGIKNIDKNITLNFYKKTINKYFDPEQYKVKAIYGENGSGKTAVVLGVQLLKDILLENNYLGDSANQKYLDEIINKKTKRFHIESEFLCRFNNNFNIYKYSFSLVKNEIGKYIIAQENLYIKSSLYATSKYKMLFEIADNEIRIGNEYSYLLNTIRLATANLLGNMSLIDIMTGKLGDFGKEVFITHLAYLHLYATLLITSIDDTERYNKLQSRESIIISDVFEGLADIRGNVTPRIDWVIGNNRLVLKDNISDYETEVGKLKRFIKLFKRDLVDIEIDKKENNEVFDCSLIMVYDGYKVHVDFESTGIKKLIALFDYLSFAMDGKIVFIDEMDSNINDVYLCKIVEFFKLYGKGQLCFTTHSTSPMEVLKDSKNSIDFLSSDSRIVPWKKNGNYTPESLYRKGMIEYLPFNIEAEDFLGILGD